MKPFHMWVSDHENSIEDPNIIKKTNDVIQHVTNLQTRAAFASLLVGEVKTASDAASWMHIFTLQDVSTLATHMSACSYQVKDVIGERKAKSYSDADYSKKALWVNDFIVLINTGWVSEDAKIKN